MFLLDDCKSSFLCLKISNKNHTQNNVHKEIRTNAQTYFRYVINTIIYNTLNTANLWLNKKQLRLEKLCTILDSS